MDYSLLTKEKISRKYNSLTQELRDVLSSAQTLTAIENIAAKYRLGEEKTEMLVQLVGLVILGFVSFENMKEEMREAIEVDPQFIPLIADEINQKIFGPIINFLPKTPTVPVPDVAPAFGAKGPLDGAAGAKSTPAPGRPDRYREPATPEVVDLRKAPPVPVPKFPSVETEGQMDKRDGAPKASPTPAPGRPIAPKPMPIPPRPAPIPIKPPLIEAEPHKVPAPISVPVPEPLSRMPQIILRSPGLPPTGSPRDILDLRKDKGEF